MSLAQTDEPTEMPRCLFRVRLLTPAGEYDGMICAASPMRAIAATTVATCFTGDARTTVKKIRRVKVPPPINGRLQCDPITSHPHRRRPW